MRRLIALLLLLLASPAAADMYQDGSNAKLPEARTNLGIRSFSPVKDHGADPTGATDATTAIQASQADCVAAGGGVIDITGARLLIDSASLIILGNCPIVGNYVPHRISTGSYAADTSVLLLNPIYPITFGHGAQPKPNGTLMRGVLVLNKNWSLPANARAVYQMVTGVAPYAGMYTGTAIVLATPGVVLRDVQVLGFATCLSSPAGDQYDITNFAGDCTNGIAIQNSHDKNALRDVEFWPYLVPGGMANPTTTVTGAADNGSGNIRLTVGSTAAFLSNDVVFVSLVPGYTGANSKCTATIINATTLDCTNLVSAPTATAKVTAGSNVVVLTAPNPSIRRGQAVTDTTTGGNIPAATVSYVSGVYVYLSAAATGTGAADTLAFANGAFGGAGGNVYLDLTYRSGTAFNFNNVDYTTGDTLFSFNYAIGFDLNGFHGSSIVNAATDGVTAEQNPTSVGVWFRGDSHNSKWSGPFITYGVVFDTTVSPQFANTVESLWLRQPADGIPTVAVRQGKARVVNSASLKERPAVGAIMVVNDGTANAATAQFCSSDFGLTDFLFDSDAAYLRTDVCPGVIFASGVAATQIARRQDIGFATNATVAAGSTVFMGNGAGLNAAEGVIAWVSTQQGRLSNLTCINSGPPGGAETQVVTARPNLADAAFGCTITGAGRTCTDPTRTAVVPVGARNSWKIVASAAAAASAIQCSATLSSP